MHSLVQPQPRRSDNPCFRRRSIVATSFILVLTYPITICSFPLLPFSCPPIRPLVVRHSMHDKEDAPMDAASDSEKTNDGVVGDTDDEAIPRMKSAIKSSSTDLTDRFKYKVNALMGTYDPIDEAKDTEYEQGNILSAMLQFPVVYTFHVVGRTAGTGSAQFVQQVKDIMTGDDDQDQNDIKYQVIPRGSKFTKISIEKQVVNAQEITTIYARLSQLEFSVMQF